MENSWKFYLSSPDAWQAMLNACRNAKTSIDLEQFILHTDEIGNQFIAVLKEKAKEGVNVRLLVDSAGSFGFYSSLVPDMLREQGVKVSFFNTFFPGAKASHTPWLFRDHQKLLIVDSAVAFTGSICLGEEMRDWRDTHVEVRGSIIPGMEYEFNKMWKYSHKRRFRPKMKKPLSPDGLNYITNAPLPRRRFLYFTLIEAIRGSTKYIYLTTPYFIPDRRLFRVLSLAARRGVDVKILLPFASDHWFADIASHSHFGRTLMSGIKIFRYKNKMIHAKTGVIDGDWATVGSLNLDNVSLRYNFEGNIVATDKRFAEELKEQFLEDLSHAEELLLDDWQKRSLWQKFKELLILPIRWFL